MRHLHRLLRSRELLIILPICWIVLFSWPMVIDPAWLSSGEVYLYYVILWCIIIVILLLMSIAYRRDSQESGEER